MKDGKFKYVKEINGLVNLTFRCGDDRYMATVAAEKCTIESENDNFVLKGSAVNDRNIEYIEGMSAARKLKDKDKSQRMMLQHTIDYAKKYANDTLMPKVIRNIVYNIKSGGGSADLMYVLHDQLNDFQNEKWVKKIRYMADYTDRRKPGTKFIDYTAKNMQGDNYKLQDNLGEYTIVDVWASWCGWCRKGMPELKYAYSIYKEKGLKVVCISLDRNTDTWEKAVFEDKTQDFVHLSTGKEYADTIAKHYGITGIPTSFLLDKNGNIVANNVKKEKLAQILKEVFI